MTSHFKFTYRIGLAALIVFLASGIGRGAELESPDPADSGFSTFSGTVDEKIAMEEQEPAPAKVESHTLVEAFAGYRFFSVNRFGGRAAQYEYLHSSPVLSGLGVRRIVPHNQMCDTAHLPLLGTPMLPRPLEGTH